MTVSASAMGSRSGPSISSLKASRSCSRLPFSSLLADYANTCRPSGGRCPHHSHSPWSCVLPWDCGCWCIFIRVPIPDSGLHGSAHLRRQTLPTVQPTSQQPSPWLASLHSLWEDIQCRILRAALHLPQTQPSPITLPPSPWLAPRALVTLRNTNAGDVRCISWILWSITDPEALDAAIRLAGTVRWFEDGLDVEPPYDQIVSLLKGCFDSAGRVYPGARDRAYHSARAALWIHIRALCVSKGFAKRFPFPTVSCDMTSSLDPDL